MAKSTTARNEEQLPATTGAAATLPTLTDEDYEALRDLEGAGLSDDVADHGTPLIYIAQKMSPVLDRQHASYVEGMREGMAYNNLTGQHWDAEKEGFPFIPCFFRANWAEWTPREEGGGFHGLHPRDVDMQQLGAQPFRDKKGEVRRDRFVLASGHELILTHHYFGVVPDSLQAAIVPMSSTNLKGSQQLQALIKEQRAQHAGRVVQLPAFMRTYSLRTVYDKNDQGSWYKWSPKLVGPTADPVLLSLCREVALAAKRNEIKMAAPDAGPNGGSGSGEGEVVDGEIPF